MACPAKNIGARDDKHNSAFKIKLKKNDSIKVCDYPGRASEKEKQEEIAKKRAKEWFEAYKTGLKLYMEDSKLQNDKNQIANQKNKSRQTGGGFTGYDMNVALHKQGYRGPNEPPGTNHYLNRKEKCSCGNPLLPDRRRSFERTMIFPGPPQNQDTLDVHNLDTQQFNPRIVSTPDRPRMACKRRPSKCRPIITGRPEEDIAEKHEFQKLKKIELDAVLDRNVIDLSLDHPDRNPTVIASLLNERVPMDNDVFDTVDKFIPVLCSHKLNAFDVHRSAPGSMVPQKIPVPIINLIGTEVLYEVEAVLKSKHIDYPSHDIATHELSGFDVMDREREIPKPKEKEPKSFTCVLEIQPLRVENFFQLRGSDNPSWYPGMMTSFPDGDSGIRQFGDHPCRLIESAWMFCQP